MEIEHSSLSITFEGIQFSVRGTPSSPAQTRSVRMEDIDPTTIKVSRTSLESSGPSVEHSVAVLGNPGWEIYWKNREDDARKFADALFALVQAARSGGGDDSFEAIAAQYRAAGGKPAFPEAARRLRVQAEFAVEQKRFDDAVRYYGEALRVAPWWPEGRFNLALVLAETKRYPRAIAEMQRFLALEPQHPQARAAQDQIYRWESVPPQ
ncbi:MAG: tetratricopeptide repeat protein [Betaproteobacteria bacterium]